MSLNYGVSSPLCFTVIRDIICPVKAQKYCLFIDLLSTFSKQYRHHTAAKTIQGKDSIRNNISKFHKFVPSFIPLPSAECDNSLPFSAASSIPIYYVRFPATLLHQLFLHPLSPHRVICFLVYLSILVFQNSFGNPAGWSKVSVHLMIRIPTQLMIWRWPSQNTFVMWTVLYWTLSSRTQFSVWINVWRLAGDTLRIACNFLYCNHQVHRDFWSPCIFFHYLHMSKPK